jgi:hypothetical protein
LINIPELMNSRDDCIDNRVSVLFLRRVLLESKLNLSFAIDSRGTEVRPAKIGGED